MKAVEDNYVTLKTRVANYINAESWEHQLDLEANPNYLDPNFWKDTDFTMFVFCPFDVTLGGLSSGQGKMTFGDFYPGENSADGRLWSFLSRQGTRVYKKADPTRSSYFKGYRWGSERVWEFADKNELSILLGRFLGEKHKNQKKNFKNFSKNFVICFSKFFPEKLGPFFLSTP